MISHRVAMRHGSGICGKLLRNLQQIPQPRRRRRDEIKNSMIRTSGAGATRLGKLYLLDTELLMGGTFMSFTGFASRALDIDCFQWQNSLRTSLEFTTARIPIERHGQTKGDVPMKKLSILAVCLLFLLGPGALICRSAAASDSTDEQMISNAEFMARHQSEGAAPDVVLPPGSDLTQFTREYLGLAPEAFVAPLIIPAADANSDSLGSPYFFSFGSGLYEYSTSSSCHMAPAYLPNTGGGVTVTVDNFFVFALDNDAVAIPFTIYGARTRIPRAARN